MLSPRQGMRFCGYILKKAQDVEPVKKNAKKCKISCEKLLTEKNKGAMIKFHRANGGGVFLSEGM